MSEALEPTEIEGLPLDTSLARTWQVGEITKLEEYALIRRAKAGDTKAMAEILEVHAPFISKVINHFTLSSWVSREDVVQEARIGMIDAVHRFDLSRNLRLCTFAYWRIHKAIIVHLTEMGYPLKVPFPDVIALKKILNRLDQGLSTDVQADLAALRSPKNVQIRSLVSGSLPINPTEIGGDTEDPLCSPLESQLLCKDASESVLGDMLMEAIIQKISELPAVEGHMLAQYLGIYAAEKPVPLKYIAGERSREIKDGEQVVDVTDGWNGFGLQIGQTYNSVSKAIKLGEAKYKAILRQFFDGLYDDYLETFDE